jgi:hypothetical protein
VQVGNRQQLDSEYRALVDAFDAIWIPETVLTGRGRRAVRCAQILSRAELHQRSPNWLFGIGWRCTAPEVLYCAAKPGARECQSLTNLIRFSDDVTNVLTA